MRIKIWQIDTRVSGALSAMFLNYERTTKYQDGVKKERYECVYDGDTTAKTLDEVYVVFNAYQPVGFRGRSMSVSDVVEVLDGEHRGVWFVDSVGFVELMPCQWEAGTC